MGRHDRDRNKRFSLAWLNYLASAGLAMAIVLSAVDAVFAAPPVDLRSSGPPTGSHIFYGMATNVGDPVSVGSTVIAEVNGLTYETAVTETITSGPAPHNYLIYIPPDSTRVNGAADGDIIQFSIEISGNTKEVTTFPFKSMETTILDLDVDLVAPIASSFLPEDNATDVSASAAVNALFSETVTIANQAGITISGSLSGNLKNGSATINSADPDQSSLVIPHKSCAALGETVTVTIGAGAVQDTSGNANAAITWSFTTYPSAFLINTSVTGNVGGKIYYQSAQVTGPVQVNRNSTPAFSFVADAGYRLKEVLVNNVAVTTTSPYTFEAISSDQTLAVTFEKIYTISITATGNGQVSYNSESLSATDSIIVLPGDQPTFDFSPAAGYDVKAVIVNGNSVADSEWMTSFTFDPINADQTLEVVFEEIYTISVTTGSNGQTHYESNLLASTDSVNVLHGDTPRFVFSPADGYAVNTITVNGSAVPNSEGQLSYLFDAVASNQTLEVSFISVPYTISFTIIGNGAVLEDEVTLSDHLDVNYGATPTFTFEPGIGYRLKDVRIGSDVVSTSSPYTLPAVTSNLTLNVTFEKIPYTITVTTQAHGKVSYNGVVLASSATKTVYYGDTPAFTFLPDSGYQVSAVTVNGISLTDSAGLTSYTFAAVTANQTLVVSFEVIPVDTRSVYLPFIRR